MYKTKLSKWDTQLGVALLEKSFKEYLESQMGLHKITGPLLVDPKTGTNDELSEVESPLSFDYEGERVEVVQSAAKWKRHALGMFKVPMHKGIFIEMNAIRKDESQLSKYHSLHVDQYDWEMVISKEDRNIDFLKLIVEKIWEGIKQIKKIAKAQFNQLTCVLADKVTFISSEELLALYPKLSALEREKEFAKLHKAIFIHQIGEKLSNGIEHGLRAPDYDDWSLNGDLIVWDEINQDALEISSMGIRVDAQSMDKQLTKMNADHKRNLDFHKAILQDKLPLSIGGGIGRSRVNMFILEKAHIGEVLPSFTPKSQRTVLLSKRIDIL